MYHCEADCKILAAEEKMRKCWNKK